MLRNPAVARIDAGTRLAQHRGMALFWETSQTPKSTPKPAPLSPLAVALLLKLQTDVAGR
jgi:hypothetical protein